MNGEQITESYDEVEDELESVDDESVDDESAEFFPLPIPGLFGGGGRRRSPLSPLPPFLPLPGVGTATLNTPRGAATLRLPTDVVTKSEFTQVTQRLQTAINQNTTRINTTQNDIQSLRRQVGTVVTKTRRDLAKVQKEQKTALIRERNERKADIIKLRKDQSSQAMTNMLVSVMMQQRLQDRVDQHTHPGHLHELTFATDPAANDTVKTELTPISTPSAAAGDNMALMFIPLMLMGSPEGGSSDSNMMMMMVMMMALQDR